MKKVTLSSLFVVILTTIVNAQGVTVGLNFNVSSVVLPAVTAEYLPAEWIGFELFGRYDLSEASQVSPYGKAIPQYGVSLKLYQNFSNFEIFKRSHGYFYEEIGYRTNQTNARVVFSPEKLTIANGVSALIGVGGVTGPNKKVIFFAGVGTVYKPSRCQISPIGNCGLKYCLVGKAAKKY